MAKRIIYQCDKCGKQYECKPQSISSSDPVDSMPSDWVRVVIGRADVIWCHNCKLDALRPHPQVTEGKQS